MPPYLAILFIAILVLLMLAFHMLIVFWARMRGVNWLGIQLHTGIIVIDTALHETTPSLSREDVKKLPCYIFKNDNDRDGEENHTGNGSVVCAICLENFHSGEKCRLLPLCKHSFHARCVDSWLIKCPLCPICRGRVEVINGRDHVFIGIPESSNASLNHI